MQSFWYNLNYIINRYIDSNGEYIINISSKARNRIKVAFQPYSHKFIPETSGFSLSRMLSLQSSTSKHVELGDTTPVNTHIDKNITLKFVGLLDEAMNEVMSLLSGDSFMRFTQTKEFKQMYANIH